jgi:hypothetical protein
MLPRASNLCGKISAASMLLISGEIPMFRRCAIVTILATFLAVTAFADMKAKSRMTMGQAGGMSFDSTNYVKGARERREMNMMGMQQVQIYQCDLKRMALINEKNRTYMITELGDVEESSSDPAPAQKSSKSTSTSSAPPLHPVPAESSPSPQMRRIPVSGKTSSATKRAMSRPTRRWSPVRMPSAAPIWK